MLNKENIPGLWPTMMTMAIVEIVCNIDEYTVKKTNNDGIRRHDYTNIT